MNIKEAKQEIANTLRAYHRKDELGRYVYPLVRQRPILLMGPPGIGKTAIMEQVAKECQVGLVAYTITHHTRQSAIGLPHIETRTFEGRQVDVTEYTLSEIIASVYECMERTGKKEGLLFIDEINCVSETLAPTMLQFLQNKTFGSHRVPDGWMIVAAGNPPEYNKSVREFDIVTLDRVRKIEIEADCDVWMEYAASHGVHGAVLSYLQLKKDNFYQVKNTVDAKTFVTARGWEDLSEVLKSYEALEIPVTAALMLQFLQKEEVARDFAAYYQLYKKYGRDYAIVEILTGACSREVRQQRVEMAREASFEERFTVVGLVQEFLGSSFAAVSELEKKTELLHSRLSYLKNYLAGKASMECFEEFIRQQEESLRVREVSELVSSGELRRELWMTGLLHQYELELKKLHIRDTEEGFEKIRGYFREFLEERQQKTEEMKCFLDRGFAFIDDCFGQGQEMVLFVTGLTRNEAAMEFVSANGSEAYFAFSEKLLSRKREEELRQACMKELL